MNRGMALITVLITTFLLFALVGAFLFLTMQARILHERHYENMVALGLAEAGVDYAIWEIKYGGTDFAGWNEIPSGSHIFKTSLPDFSDASGNEYGDINITVDRSAEPNVITAEGTFSSLSGPALSRTVRVLVRKDRLFGEYGVLTVERITMTGNAGTDGYDSSKGDYGASYDGKINIDQNGNILTNGTGAPAISLTGNATVKGNANTGPEGTISKTGNASITGTESHNADEEMPEVELPQLSWVYCGSLSLSGNNSLTRTTNNYQYDSITLSGNSKLTLSGEINIYVTGNIQTSGNSQIIIEPDSAVSVYFDGNTSISGNGVWNKTKDPSELSFFGRPTSTNVSLSGNSDFYGTVYAPSAGLDISGNGCIYGAVGGGTLTLSGNAKVHFDEQLKNDGPAMGYEPYVWQEK